MRHFSLQAKPSFFLIQSGGIMLTSKFPSSQLLARSDEEEEKEEKVA